jgi:general secretion pathway protein K
MKAGLDCRVAGRSITPMKSAARGVALITVLMILVFLSVVSIYAAETQNISLRRTQNIVENEQAFQIAAGGEQWAVKILEKDMAADLEQPDDASDHLGESWANLGGIVKVEGTESYMLVTLLDQHGKLNLNNLVQGKPVPGDPESGQDDGAENDEDAGQENENNPEGENQTPEQEQEEQSFEEGNNKPPEASWYEIFLAMFISLDLDPELVDVVIDWIDSNSEVTGSGGAEDRYYSELEVPYLAANQPMVSLAELVYLKGFSDEVIETLLPYVTVIPISGGQELSRINVNTASAEILAFMSADPLASAEQFIALIELRGQQPFRDTEEFTEAYRANTPFTLKPGIVNFFNVRSDYFISRVCVESGRIKLGHYSLLRKNRDNENVTVHYRQQVSGCPVLVDEKAENVDNT